MILLHEISNFIVLIGVNTNRLYYCPGFARKPIQYHIDVCSKPSKHAVLMSVFNSSILSESLLLNLFALN